MMNEKKIARMEEIKEWAEAHSISVYEAVYELLFSHYFNVFESVFFLIAENLCIC